MLSEPKFKAQIDSDTTVEDQCLAVTEMMSSTVVSSGGTVARLEPDISSIEVSTSSSFACDLSDFTCKGKAYLTQHRNKKKCQDRQRVMAEERNAREASTSMGSMPESDKSMNVSIFAKLSSNQTFSLTSTTNFYFAITLTCLLYTSDAADE